MGSIFVISARTPEALEPVQGHLELEARSRSVYVALSTASSDFASAPLLKDYVRLPK